MVSASPQLGPVRTGRVVLAALVTQLVVIGATGNQWVTEKVANSLTHSFVHGGSTGSQDLRAAVLTYNWRFTPQAQDTEHSWLSQVLMILTVLVLTALLVAAVVRGTATFVRAFAGCWMAVIAATLVGAYVRGFVRNETGTSALRITRAVFGNFGPTTVTMFAAFVLGLVVAIVGAFVAVWTRPTVPAVDWEPAEDDSAFPLPPEQPPAYLPPPSDRPLPSSPAPRPSLAEQPTTWLRSFDEATTRYPRPPDDDDIR